MSAELALNHLAVLAPVYELDWIFEADDVQLPGLVQVVDHRGERGRLARAGGAGDQDHALVKVAELGHGLRERQLFQGRDFRRNGPESRADARLLAVDVHPKTAPLRGNI